MAITLVNTHSAGAAAVTAITNNVPTGTVNGDYMLWGVGGAQIATAPTTPTGWALWQTLTTTGLGFWIYSRIASSEPASYTMTLPSSRWVGTIASWRGVDTTTPNDVANTTAVSTAGTATPAAITPVTAGAAVTGWEVGLAGNGVVTVTWSSTNTTVVAQVTSPSSTATNPSSGLGYIIQGSPAAFTPNLSASVAFTRNVVVTSALRPAAGGGGGTSTPAPRPRLTLQAVNRSAVF